MLIKVKIATIGPQYILNLAHVVDNSALLDITEAKSAPDNTNPHKITPNNDMILLKVRITNIGQQCILNLAHVIYISALSLTEAESASDKSNHHKIKKN